MQQREPYIPFGHTVGYAIDYLVGILKDARLATLERVQDLSTQELHWQFAECWNTIGVLLSHITAVQHYFRIVSLENRELTDNEEKRIMPAMEMGQHIPQLMTDQPVEDYIEAMEEARQQLTEKIAQLSGAVNENTQLSRV